MPIQNLLRAGLVAALAAGPAFAEGSIMVEDAYARSSNPKVAAAFMSIVNAGDTDDRLVAAQSDAAARVELHTHRENAEGVMQMVHVVEGFPLPAGGTTMLERGGRHVMLMGLTEPLAQGDTVEITLTFEKAGEIALTIPVDNDRAPGHGGHGMSN